MWNTGQINAKMDGTPSLPPQSQTGSPASGPLPREHQVPWGKKAFPADGSGVTVKINPGDRVRFQAVDNEYHNLSEAVMKEDDGEACGYNWTPHPRPQLECNYRGSHRFNQMMTFPESGIYHLVCPIGDNHKVMRVTVMSSTNPSHVQAFNQAKQQDMARQESVPVAPVVVPTGTTGMFPSFGGFSFASMFPSMPKMNFTDTRCVVGPLGAVVDCPPDSTTPHSSASAQTFPIAMPPFISKMFGRTPAPSPHEPKRYSDETTDILNGI